MNTPTAITLHAKASAEFDLRVEQSLEQLLAAAQAHPGAIVQATSLGVEDMVITDLIARHQLPIALATLDTGALHEQTLALIPRINERYGLAVERYAPVQQTVVHFVRDHGERAMYDSVDLRNACCAIRKLEPLARMLASRSAWVTGLRREQSNSRAVVSASEIDDQGRVKYSPLADWTWGDLWHYVAIREVPYNALHDEFYPSIGCAPCTRAVAIGEDFRAGRWWWEQEGAKECGLHVAHDVAHSTVSNIKQTGAAA
jgi:phosphoadenosine phosphosulfate reductase